MARGRSKSGGKGGGGDIATTYLKTGLNILLVASVGMVVIMILASVLGQIVSQYTISESNPLYSLTSAYQTAVETVAGFVGPLILIGVAVLIILAVSVLLKVFK